MPIPKGSQMAALFHFNTYPATIPPREVSEGPGESNEYRAHN